MYYFYFLLVCISTTALLLIRVLPAVRISHPAFFSFHAFLKLLISVSQQIQQERVSIKVNLITACAHNVSNISGSINTSQRHETRILLDRVTNESCRFSFSFGFRNDSFFLLLRTKDNVLGSFSVLLS